MDKDQQKAITDSYKKAKRKIKSARRAMQEAIDACTLCGTLLDDLRPIEKRELLQFTAITPEDVKDYTAEARASDKRPAIQDKKRLQRIGLMDKQPNKNWSNLGKGKRKHPITYTGTIMKAQGNFSKLKEKNPVDEMSEWDKAMVWESLKRLVKDFKPRDH